MMRYLLALLSVLVYGTDAVAYAIADLHEIGDEIDSDCDAASCGRSYMLPRDHVRWAELQSQAAYVRMCESWHMRIWGEIRL